MNSLLLSIIVVSIMMTLLIPPSFGQLSGIDAEFYYDDKRIYDPILQKDQETQIMLQIFYGIDSETVPVKIFIIDNPTESVFGNDEYNVVETLYDEEIILNSESPHLFSILYSPKQIGQYALVVSSANNFSTTASIENFVVSDKVSDVFKENNMCREGFVSIVKSTYSSVSCVTIDTQKTLLERGWVTPNPY